MWWGKSPASKIEDAQVALLKGIALHIEQEAGYRSKCQEFYREAEKVIPRAAAYAQWADRGEPILKPFSKLLNPAQVDGYLSRIQKYKSIKPEESRGISLGFDMAHLTNDRTPPSWHAIKIISDTLSLKTNYDALKASVAQSGPTFNVLDKDGIMIPGRIQAAGRNDQGWMFVDGIDVVDGKPAICGTVVPELPPLITQEDLDVAIWLAFFEGREPIAPRFSLDEASFDVVLCRLNQKRFHPDWLGDTAFGRSLFLADWIMKASTMGDGLPSLTQPYKSGGTVAGWKAPALFMAIHNAPNSKRWGVPDERGRLEIVLRGAKLAQYVDKKGFFQKPNLQYRFRDIDLFVESSLYIEESNGRQEHRYHNDVSTQSGKRAEIILKNYEYISDLFPVFRRVKLNLALFNMLAQARKQGAYISDSERRRISSTINRYKASARRSQVDFVPKPYHNRGCICTGGVSSTANGTIAQPERKPFDGQNVGVNFLVTSSGFTSPVPDGATGPHRTRTGEGLFYGGGLST